MDTKELGYSPEELSTLLPLSVQTLARDRKNGHIGLPFKKMGRKIVYPAQAIQEWLKNTTISPSTFQAKVVSVNKSEVKRSRGRPVGTTKSAISKRQQSNYRSSQSKEQNPKLRGAVYDP